MKLGHYVVIHQGRRRIPGRNACRLVYRSALDRKTHELLKKSDDSRLIQIAGCNVTYYITDDLYRKIHDSVFEERKDDDEP